MSVTSELSDDFRPLPEPVQSALHHLMIRFPAWTDTFPIGRRPDVQTLSARMRIITDAFANGYRLGYITLECLETALLLPMPRSFYFLCDRCECFSRMREKMQKMQEWWQTGEDPPTWEQDDDVDT